MEKISDRNDVILMFRFVVCLFFKLYKASPCHVDIFSCHLLEVPPPNSSYLNSCVKNAGISIQVGHLCRGYSVQVIGS